MVFGLIEMVLLARFGFRVQFGDLYFFLKGFMISVQFTKFFKWNWSKWMKRNQFKDNMTWHRFCLRCSTSVVAFDSCKNMKVAVELIQFQNRFLFLHFGRESVDSKLIIYYRTWKIISKLREKKPTGKREQTEHTWNPIRI